MTEDRATRASQAPHGPHTPPGGPGPHPAPADASQGRTAGRVVTGGRTGDGPRVIACSAKPYMTTGTCPNPAEHRITIGCVHEHVKTGPVCTDHLARMLRADNECTDCRIGPSPHRCPLIGKETTDA